MEISEVQPHSNGFGHSHFIEGRSRTSNCKPVCLIFLKRKTGHLLARRACWPQ